MELQPQIAILLTGQAITILALLATNYINRKQSNHLLESELQIRKKVEHLQKQLTLFYGPIYALLKMNGAIVRVRYDPDTQQYTNKVPNELWQDLRDNIVRPNNIAIVKTIKENFYLVTEAEIPSHIISFIMHVEVWARREETGMEQKDYLDNFGFPSEFEEYINETTRQLKAEYDLLVSRKK